MAAKIPKLDSRKEAEEIEESERGNWISLPPELFNMIFNHLPVADLLSCSVVSTTWKKASRDVLKRSRECYAYIKHFPQDVHDLMDKIASTDLKQMVNGLHIQMRANSNEDTSSLRHKFSCSEAVNICKCNEIALKLRNVALSGQMKYLSLDMQNEWEEGLSTCDELLMREIISVTSESLQKLVIWQDRVCDFLCSCETEFPNLKVVQIKYGELLKVSYLNDFLTAFAPNLQEITGGMLGVSLNDVQNPLMLKRCKNLMICYDELDPEDFMEDYQYISGLHRLDLRVGHCDSLDDDKVLFSMLLQSSNTLEELQIYTPEFYSLFKTTSHLKFPNLRRLSLAADWNMPARYEIAILKQLNLPKLCPSLEQLELLIDQENHEDDLYTEDDWTPAVLPYGVDKSDVAVQIEFEYYGGRFSQEYFKFLNKVYPKINKVRIIDWELGHRIYEMNSIFSDFRSLEYLEIIVGYWCPCVLDFQMDALLCGISIQEVEFLFNSSPSTNAELNPCIVPIRPSLFNAKNLKELKITGVASGPDGVVNRSWIILVTENLPMRHVRHLKVTFEGTDELFNRLNRLQAFTTLLCDRAKM